VISAFAEAAQDTSPDETMQLLQKMGDIVLFASFTGSTVGAQTANTGRGFIVLKPRDDRELNASQIVDRLRPRLAQIQGATLFLQPAQDITVGGRVSRAQFQHTLQDSNMDELSQWLQKMLEKCSRCPNSQTSLATYWAMLPAEDHY
jgi:multidrug efflux pump subunit AcrB